MSEQPEGYAGGFKLWPNMPSPLNTGIDRPDPPDPPRPTLGVQVLSAEEALLERIMAAVAAHEPEDGCVQWYVDDLAIDCDAGEFWHVVRKALALPPGEYRVSVHNAAASEYKHGEPQ